MNSQNKSIIEPSLTDTLLVLKDDIFTTLNTSAVGEIQSFDPAKKTAQIKMLFKRILPDGTTVSRSPLVDCPVVTLQGGSGFIQFPIAAGDQCLVFFADRNIDAWFESGSEAVPFDNRCHDLSDGFALVGVNALPSSLVTSYLPNQVTLYYQGSEVVLKQGSVLVTDGNGDQVTLMAGITTVTNLSGAQLVLSPGSAVLTNGAGVTLTIAGGTIVMTNGAGGVNLNMASGAISLKNGTGSELNMTSGLIGIKNATTSLLTVIRGLITVIESLSVQDGANVLPLTGAAVATLEAYKTTLGTLLQ